MKLSLTLSVAAAALASALPSQGTQNISQPFYLVSTTSQQRASNSSTLANVSALSLYDPDYQEAELLRTIEPGYGSSPTFTLSNGLLHTIASGPHGVGTYEYNSTEVIAGADSQFLAQDVETGDSGINNGYLLAVNGTCEGWTICDGQDERVIEYKGTDASCTKTYIQAVSKPPY